MRVRVWTQKKKRRVKEIAGGEGYGVAEQRMARKTRGWKKKTKPGENVISRAGGDSERKTHGDND